MTNFIMLSGNPIASVGGYTIAGVGYVIVFVALIILVCIFTLVPRVIQYFLNKKLEKTKPAVSAAVKEKSAKAGMDANINAAIAMAIHLYFDEQHDTESNIITIKNAQKQYSPWNSKIYGVMNQPQRKR